MWKIGRLAKHSGLSVRTLRHYDSIGLLTPSQRSDAGYRIYSDGDAQRLAQILALRSLGLSLPDIAKTLDAGRFSLAECLEAHTVRLDEAIAEQQAARRRTKALLTRLRDNPTASEDEIKEAMEVIQMFEKYYTPEQLEQLQQRAESVGEDRMQQVQQEWTVLFDDYRKAMEQGLAPDSPEVQKLGARSKSLIAEFTGGDPGIEKSLGNMYQQEGPQQVLEPHGQHMDGDLWAYMAQAQQASTD